MLKMVTVSAVNRTLDWSYNIITIRQSNILNNYYNTFTLILYFEVHGDGSNNNMAYAHALPPGVN